MLTDERLELRDELRVLLEGQFGFDPLLDRRQPALLEPVDLDLGERRVGDVLERPSSPQRKCFPKAPGRQVVLAGACGQPAFLDQSVEAHQVELLRPHGQLVPGRVGDDHLVAAVGVEELPQARHLDLERVGSPVGCLSAPELLDQEVARNDLIWVHEEDRQKRPPLDSADPKRAPLILDLQWSKNPVVHVPPAARAVLRP